MRREKGVVMRRVDSAKRPTRVIVDLYAIARNIHAIRRRISKGCQLMAVVKADGFGHGAVPVARTAIENGAEWLGVALVEEGRELRSAGIDVPILVLGMVHREEIETAVGAKLDVAVCTEDLVETLNREARRASKVINVHIKVDTGLGRIGIVPERTVSFARRIHRKKHLFLRGIFSHFASADRAEKDSAEAQLRRFCGVLQDLEKAKIDVQLRHIANSAAILDLPESYYDMVRAGIAIYGLYPSKEVSHSIKLVPSMTLKTKVAFIKQLPRGVHIGYGGTFTTKKEVSTIATLPLGYADGLSRLLSNRGQVLVHDVRAPLVGAICMDMCMADVTALQDVRPGDEVIVFGRDPSVEEIAEIAHTINYEVVCGITKRVPRIYIH